MPVWAAFSGICLRPRDSLGSLRSLEFETCWQSAESVGETSTVHTLSLSCRYGVRPFSVPRSVGGIVPIAVPVERADGVPIGPFPPIPSIAWAMLAAGCGGGGRKGVCDSRPKMA